MSDPVRSFAYAENPCRLVHETLLELFPKKVTLHLFHSWEGGIWRACWCAWDRLNRPSAYSLLDHR